MRGDRQAEAQRAAQIVEDPVYKNAFELVQRGIVRELQQSSPTDHERQLKLVTMLQLLNKVHNALNSTIENGQLADNLLKKKTLTNKEGI